MDYLNKEQLRDLFRDLGLADRTLQDHYATPGVGQYADSLLRAWINEEDYVPTGGATWETLKTTLESIGCGGAANQIYRQKYPLSEDGAPSDPQPSPLIQLESQPSASASLRPRAMSAMQTIKTGRLSKQPYNILYLLSFSLYPAYLQL